MSDALPPNPRHSEGPSRGIRHQLLIGVCLNATAALIATVATSSVLWLTVLSGFMSVCSSGLALVHFGKLRSGAALIILGSLGFLPVGVVSLSAALRLLRQQLPGRERLPSDPAVAAR